MRRQIVLNPNLTYTCDAVRNEEEEEKNNSSKPKSGATKLCFFI